MAAKRMLLSGLGLLTLTVGVTALAWACTPNADVYVTGSGGSGFAYPGTSMMAEVRAYEAGAAVTVHWNGANGPVVARGTGPAFAATFPVPNVADGVYTVVSKGLDSGGTVRLGQASVRVGEPGAASAPAAGDGAESMGGSTAGGGNLARTPAPAGGTSGSASGSEGPAQGTGGSTTVSGAERGVARTRAQGAGSAGKSGAGTAGAAGVKTLASGQTVFADSVGADTPKGVTPAKRGTAARAAKGAAPSKRSASGDLWSGFASGKASAASLGGSAGPASGPGSALTLGLALSALGLLVLGGGVGVAEMRRRRRLARSGA